MNLENILAYGIILVIVILEAFVVKGIEKYNLYNSTKISFKESMDLTELPVVTFYNKDKKLNFLLDTGSNLSVINESVLNTIDHEKINESRRTIGIGGIIQSMSCKMCIHYKDKEFEDVFTIANLDEQFDLIKQEDGVTIHGILGSKFFERYKYVLDFKELVAYIK